MKKLFSSLFFIIPIILFSIHQIIEKILNFHFVFIDNYLDDLLFFPIVLPLLLIERRWLLKNKNYYFSLLECVVIVLVISLFFEEIVPLFLNSFTKDYFDYLAYFVGAIYYYVFSQKSFTLNK